MYNEILQSLFIHIMTVVSTGSLVEINACLGDIGDATQVTSKEDE